MAFFNFLLLFFCLAHLGHAENEAQSKNIPDKPKVYSLHITSNIRYRYATTVVSSRVINPANVSKEVTFNVVLPESAFITGFVMIINEKEYWAYVKEKEEAMSDYKHALEQGLAAAHISYNARNSNNFDVAVNIEPMSKVTFNLTYEDFLERRLSAYNHEININPGQVVPDMVVDVNIQDASPIVNLKVPDLRLTNEIVEHEKDNPYVVIEKQSPEMVSIRWTMTEEQQKELNADGVKGQLALKYDVDRSKNPHQILVDEGYFVHFYSDDALEPLKKHVVFVLDLSGSMHGRKLQQVKEAMNQILTDLKPEDYFSLVLFSDTSKAWAPDKEFHLSYSYNKKEPEEELTTDYVVAATKENVEKAKTFINGLDDLGATNIISGLRKGLKLTKIGKDFLKNSKDGIEPLVIFLTDGQPNVEMSDPNEITKTATSLNTNRSPLYSLAFGDGADINFLKKLSLANAALSRVIYEASDATLQLKLFYKEVASPLLSNVTFDYVSGQVGNETTKVHFENLFSGGELVVAGDYSSDSISGMLLGSSAKGIKQIPFSDVKPIFIRDFLPPIPQPKNRTFGHLEKLWAYKSIKQLLDSNTVTNNNKTKEKALELALKYSFVTPVTSLVVVKPNKTSTVNAEKAQGTDGIHAIPHQYGAAAAISSFPGNRISVNALALGRKPIMVAGGAPFIASGFSRPSFGGYGARPAAAYGPPPIQQSADYLTISLSPALTTPRGYSYKDVTWLNKTSSADGLYLAPPVYISSDVISLNATNIAYHECTAVGVSGHCRHFIHCILNDFVIDESGFLNYKCHIEPNFLGVCCPM